MTMSDECHGNATQPARLHDEVKLGAPLGVVRVLLEASSYADNWPEELDERFWKAVRWLATHTPFREEVLTEEWVRLVEDHTGALK